VRRARRGEHHGVQVWSPDHEIEIGKELELRMAALRFSETAGVGIARGNDSRAWRRREHPEQLLPPAAQTDDPDPQLPSARRDRSSA
jgi:hypothetical protein